MVPDSLYSLYHFSHPPLVERLRAIKANTPETKTGGSRKHKATADNNGDWVTVGSKHTHNTRSHDVPRESSKKSD